MLIRILLTTILASGSLIGYPQKDDTRVNVDLRDTWTVYDGEAFQPFEATNTHTIYFSIHASRYPGGKLLVKSSSSYLLLLNGKLIDERKGSTLLSLDSLSYKYQSQLLFSVYQENFMEENLQTVIIKPQQAVAAFTKPLTFFKDFIIVAGLLVVIFFVVMIRVHPKLASDYFSVARILSLREADDNQLNSRFALSSNILFYIFCSLLMGLCLMVLFQNLPEEHTLPLYFQAASFWGVFMQWIRLSLIILGVFFCKILLISGLSNLFGMRGISGIHFFNWVRLLLVIAGALTVILFIYYISRGYNSSVYVGMLVILVVMIAAWNVIAFLKLNNRTEHSLFHLFSYICATEIIPLLITIKVLFK